MVSLYLFGSGLENYLGRGNFLLIYFGSVIGGDLLSLYVHRAHVYTAYGASGGVAGVIFATILLNPWGQIMSFYYPIPIPGCLYAIGYLLYSFFGMKEHRGDVGHDAHLGGALIGFLLMAGLDFDAVRAHPSFFGIVLTGTILLLVYLWYNPLFLPVTSFLGSIGQRRNSSRTQPRRKRKVPHIDAILDKIAESGIESLTDEERRVLGETSRKYRRQGETEKPKSGLAI
jgi:hypothetical protein